MCCSYYTISSTQYSAPSSPMLLKYDYFNFKDGSEAQNMRLSFKVGAIAIGIFLLPIICSAENCQSGAEHRII